METAWIIQTMTRIETVVSMGFQELHRRIDDRERATTEQHREVLAYIRHVDRRKNGNGKNGNGHHLPWAKIATLIGLIILGCIGHIAPGALRSSVMTVLPEAIKSLIGG
jgi:hypothetical protein